MTIKRVLALFISIMLPLISLADEGMWLPSLIERGTIKQMRHAGLKLTAKELYDVNNASVNDAIVMFGGGCTGSMISPEGLLLTNHHCGYSQIQAHSSVERDLLTDGFAAMNRREELANPGLKVKFLREMRDVTALVASGQKTAQIAAAAVKGTHLQASVEPLYNGAEHYLFIYEVFTDVRLVFAPPSAIGKFGGDTDNWMWPRHTGDFSIFRVYASTDGEPADYSPKNVPYKPAKFLEISARGIREGDYTMVYGFPGRTQQYLHSKAVRYIVERANPEKIALRDMRLDVMNSAADTSKAVRIKYASKNAGVANAWKKWQGEMLGLKRLGTVTRKESEERAFEKWAAGTPYAEVADTLGATYDSIEQYAYARDIFAEAIWGSERMKFMKNSPREQDSLRAEFDKNFEPLIDSIITERLFAQAVDKLDAKWLPASFSAQSVPTNELAAQFKKIEDSLITPSYNRLNKRLDSLYTIYIAGLRAMQPEREFYPDANMTLRIAYGNVKGYEPSDGVYFKPVSTVSGIIEKDRPEVYDYNVPQRLRDIAPENMEVPVAFIATNHTSGGNSGSPVLDANGRLIGLNFDRVWQGTMSDIEFDASVCRNISLDIRFVLFIVDKYAGAGYLIDEMKIVR